MPSCKDLVVLSGNISFVLLLAWTFPFTKNAGAQNVPNEGFTLSWPGHLGKTGEEAITCLTVPRELEQEIKDRVEKGDETYTTACRITESLVVLLGQLGRNSDPLSVLDLTRRDKPIELVRGLPWAERIMKDKSDTPYIVVGASHLGDVFYSIVSIYSTRTWEQTVLAKQVGVDNQNDSLECPGKGGYGYDTTKSVFQETHRYEDQNGDRFEDIVVETVETSCSTHKSKASTIVFLATDHGFKKAAPPRPSKKSSVRARRP